MSYDLYTRGPHGELNLVTRGASYRTAERFLEKFPQGIVQQSEPDKLPDEMPPIKPGTYEPACIVLGCIALAGGVILLAFVLNLPN